MKPQDAFSLRTPRAADILNISFLLLLSLVVIVFRDRVAEPALLLLLYAGLIALQLLLIRHRDYTPAVRFFYDIGFPTVSIFAIFDSLGAIVHSVNPRDIDYLLIRADYLIFGGHPTVMLEPLTHPLLTEILQIAYTSYYLLPVVYGITLIRRRDAAVFDHSLFLIMLCFYLSYVGYLLAPAVGPRYTMHHLQNVELDGFLMAGPIQNLLNLLEGVKRDAFPSGHTAIALTVLALSYRNARHLLPVFVPCVAGLIAATVYCRYHYVVDVIAGVLLFTITLFVGEALYGYWNRGAHPRR